MHDIPAAALEFLPEHALVLDRDKLRECLCRAPRGSSPGPGGCTYEHLKVCLDDQECFELLANLVEDFARGHIPKELASAYTSARMTAIRKACNGVRGIATGTSLRRLIAKTLARQFGEEMEEACAPFQFALSTRAGTYCMGHIIRFLTDLDPETTVLSIDGIGAYDHIYRSSMLGKLHSLPNANKLLPFVRLSYGSPSTYK